MAIGTVVRWGLAGYGDLSKNRLVDALNTPGSRLEIVWGRSLAKAQAFAEAYQIPRATDDLETLMTDVEAIYVATPVVSHIPIAEMALSRNLRVIIEKPLSPLLHSTDYLAQITANQPDRVATAYYRRLMPAAQSVKALLSAQTLGKLQRVEVEFRSLFAPAADDPKQWRCHPEIAGAGVMADAGSHRLDLLCWLLGVPQAVRANLKDPFAAGCERIAEVELRWQDHRCATCYFSWDENSWNECPGQDSIEFHFDQGRLLWSPLDQGQLRFFKDQHASGEHHSTEDQQTWIRQLPAAANPHGVLVTAFCAALPTCSVGDAIWVDRIIEAAVQSDRKGGVWIHL